MLCELLVFCDAVVDWFVVAFEFTRRSLPLPLAPTFVETPVAALGLTIWVGFVCEAWLASVLCDEVVCADAAVLSAAKTAAAMRDCFRIMVRVPY